MPTKVIFQSDLALVCAMRLEPGQASHWHTDSCHRYTQVVNGSVLRIEYAENCDSQDPSSNQFDLPTGLLGWDEPEPRIHRAVNIGDSIYEETVTFCRTEGAFPQPYFRIGDL